MAEQNMSNAEGNPIQAVDDRGTNQQEGLAILRRLRDNGFDSDDEKLGQALGRPLEEIQSWMNGSEPVDDDIIMKARGIALQRGISIE